METEIMWPVVLRCNTLQSHMGAIEISVSAWSGSPGCEEPRTQLEVEEGSHKTGTITRKPIPASILQQPKLQC